MEGGTKMKKQTKQTRRISLMPEKGLKAVVLQEWLESERGWGTRPDGCSLHRDEESRERFIAGYWQGMPDAVPDEYSRPIGEPTIAYVDKKTYEQINKSDNGIRTYERPIRS